MANDGEADRFAAVSARFLLDDLAWLDREVSRLGHSDCTRERRLADHYRALARQRRRQLGALHEGHPQTWREFLS